MIDIRGKEVRVRDKPWCAAVGVAREQCQHPGAVPIDGPRDTAGEEVADLDRSSLEGRVIVVDGRVDDANANIPGAGAHSRLPANGSRTVAPARITPSDRRFSVATRRPPFHTGCGTVGAVGVVQSEAICRQLRTQEIKSTDGIEAGRRHEVSHSCLL